MGRELSHAEAVDLLGAYALDALDAPERQAVEEHARECPACAAEVAEHREVAGLLSPGWIEPPPGVWERIAASLEEVPPPLDLAPVIAMKRRAGASSPGGRSAGPAPASGAPPQSHRRLGLGIAAAVAAAAVAMVGFLGVRVADDRHQINRLQAEQRVDDLQRAASAALAAPDARRVDLTSSDGYRTAQAVVLPDGTGYLVKNNLPALSNERTYQLWAVAGTSRISLGVLGPDPHVVPFKMDPKVRTLAITDEVAGGVETTKRDPVVLGRT